MSSVVQVYLKEPGRHVTICLIINILLELSIVVIRKSGHMTSPCLCWPCTHTGTRMHVTFHIPICPQQIFCLYFPEKAVSYVKKKKKGNTRQLKNYRSARMSCEAFPRPAPAMGLSFLMLGSSNSKATRDGGGGGREGSMKKNPQNIFSMIKMF